MNSFSKEPEEKKSLDQEVEQGIKELGRRKFLGLIGGAALIVLASKPTELIASITEPKYDLSYGTFYSLENAKNRYFDLKEAFPEINMHLLKLGGELGERYRVITYGNHKKENALKIKSIKERQFKSFLESKNLKLEEYRERIGEMGLFIKNKETILEDITPYEKAKKEAAIEEKITQKYYVLFSSYSANKSADFDKRLLQKLGFEEAIVSKETVKGKTLYKTLLGGFDDKQKAAERAKKILRRKELMDLLGVPEINVIKASYHKGSSTTDWSDSLLIKADFKPEQNKKKIAEHGKKRVRRKEYAAKNIEVPGEIDQLIEYAVKEWNNKHQGSRYKIDPDMIRAMAWRESRYNANAAGYKVKHIGNNKFRYVKDKNGNRILSAYGLIQVTPGAAKEMKKETGLDFEQVKTDPLSNLRCGIAYFGKYYLIFKGDFKRALGAYNAGPGRAMNNTHTKFAETRQYIKEIETQYRYFNGNN